ncbi:11590_t:CDS:2, partial [Ambispora gerdemannii]
LQFDPSTLKISKEPQNGVQANSFPGRASLSGNKVRIESMPYDLSSFLVSRTRIVSFSHASTVGPFEPTTNTNLSSALNVKPEAVDDYQEKQFGFIKQGRDPKFYA